jgi:cobalt/nickel transport system permease protein
MYRYIFLIIDEMHRMYRAKEARSIGKKRKYEFKALSSIIGTLFLRSYERAERVYLAMLARGFDGKIKTLKGFKIRLGDVSFLCFSLAYIIIVKLILD